MTACAAAAVGALGMAPAVAAATGTAPIAVTAAASGPAWSAVPSPNGRFRHVQLESVSCVRATACTAVGSFAFSGGVRAMFAEALAGRRWTIQRTPFSRQASDLDGVSCTAVFACMAVGSAIARFPAPQAARWNGRKWIIRSMSVPAGATVISMSGVSCSSRTACIAVGSYDPGHLLAEAWNGKKWAIMKTPVPAGGTESSLAAVSCTSPVACTAVGAFVRSGIQMGLAERWNGRQWAIQHTPAPASTRSRALTGVSCVSRTACFAVGSAGVFGRRALLAEAWNGRRWAITPTPVPAGRPPRP